MTPWPRFFANPRGQGMRWRSRRSSRWREEPWQRSCRFPFIGPRAPDKVIGRQRLAIRELLKDSLADRAERCSVVGVPPPLPCRHPGFTPRHAGGRRSACRSLSRPIFDAHRHLTVRSGSGEWYFQTLPAPPRAVALRPQASRPRAARRGGCFTAVDHARGRNGAGAWLGGCTALLPSARWLDMPRSSRTS